MTASVAADLLADLKSWFWEQDGFATEVMGFAHNNHKFFEQTQEYFDAGGEEQPLDWTQMHQQFSNQFEGRIQDFLAGHGANLESVREALAVAAETGDDEAYVMVDVMLSMTDYQPWLRSMATLAREHSQDLVTEATGAGAQNSGARDPASSSQQIEVAVPEGSGPGQVVAVDYAGCRYELTIPGGCGPGSRFQAMIQVQGASSDRVAVESLDNEAPPATALAGDEFDAFR